MPPGKRPHWVGEIKLTNNGIVVLDLELDTILFDVDSAVKRSHARVGWCWNVRGRSRASWSRLCGSCDCACAHQKTCDHTDCFRQCFHDVPLRPVCRRPRRWQSVRGFGYSDNTRAGRMAVNSCSAEEMRVLVAERDHFKGRCQFRRVIGYRRQSALERFIALDMAIYGVSQNRKNNMSALLCAQLVSSQKVRSTNLSTMVEGKRWYLGR
jgi:hypothetical protein